MWGIQFVVMLAMVGLNGIFAAFEIALASITVGRLQALVNAERRGSTAALKMKRSIEGSLAVLQLGITLVSAVAGATAGAGAQERLAPWLAQHWGVSAILAEVCSLFFVVIPLTAFMILFGELIPKIFALRNPELVLLTLSPGMNWFSYAVWPLVWVLEGTVRVLMKWLQRLRSRGSDAPDESVSTPLQELRASVAIARTSRLIGSRQERIILGAAALSERPVREIMLPTEFISLLSADSSAGDALIAAHLDMHTRFPVTDRPGDPQRIIGYVMFKDIVAHLRFSPKESTIRNIIRHINDYPDSMPIAQALEQLIRERSHIALVKDADKNVVGMVTMEDMIEEMVGEIEDEYDRLPAQIVPTGRGWIVGGGVTLGELKRRTGLSLPPPENNPIAKTMNAWVAACLDGPAVGSEAIETSVAKVLVRKTRRHKVMEVYVSPTGAEVSSTEQQVDQSATSDLPLQN